MHNVIIAGRRCGKVAAANALSRLIELEADASDAIDAPIRTVREDVAPTRPLAFAVARIAERDAARREAEDTFRAVLGNAARWIDVSAAVREVTRRR